MLWLSMLGIKPDRDQASLQCCTASQGQLMFPLSYEMVLDWCAGCARIPTSAAQQDGLLCWFHSQPCPVAQQDGHGGGPIGGAAGGADPRAGGHVHQPGAAAGAPREPQPPAAGAPMLLMADIIVIIMLLMASHQRE